MKTRLVAFVLSSFAAAAGSAYPQAATMVGPQVAPIGCPVAVSVSNDGPTGAFTSGCFFNVFDMAGNLVYAPNCTGAVMELLPGATLYSFWLQDDINGGQVAPGSYKVNVSLPDGAGGQSHLVTIGGADASVAPIGVPKIGTARSWQVCSPQDGGQIYLMAASGSANVGIPTCGGTFPLDPDPIFEASLSDPTVFINTAGLLDPVGLTLAPVLAIPANPAFIGLDVHFAAMVLDFTSPCPFRRFSAPMKVTLS